VKIVTSPKRALCLLVLPCSFLACSATTALADVIFSNLGPGNAYTQDTAYFLASTNNTQGFPSVADGFQFTTPTQGNYALGQIVAPFQNWFGLSQSGPFSLDLSLQRDNGGLPGSVVETIHYNGSLPALAASSLPPPLELSSVLHPTLQAGTPYWLVASVPSSSPYVIHWNENSTGGQDLRWFDRNGVVFVNQSDPQAAFSVLGTPAVDEPGTIALILFPFIAMIWHTAAHRRDPNPNRPYHPASS
jgi:hypothetical protein